MTPAEQAIAAQALVERLASVVDGVPHHVILVALLGMYHATAIRFPCCIDSAALNCQQTALAIARRATQLPPDGASIH